ncbi:MAG: AMP-binding protein, partial [Actinomycetota bacterium]
MLDGYAKRAALGERAYEVTRDGTTGRSRREFLSRFDTITYDELHSRVKGIANAWRAGAYRVGSGEFVCVLGFAGIDFASIELACAYAHAVCVPLQTSLAGADLDGIFTDIEPVAVATAIDDLPRAVELAARHKSIRSIVVFDVDTRIDEHHELYAAARHELAQNDSAPLLVTLDDLVALGALETFELLALSPDGNKRTALIIYSSGSTGTPKGVIYTEHMLTSMAWTPGSPRIPVVRISLAPMNHMMARSTVFNTLVSGGTVNFAATSDLSTMFEDVQLTRPTDFRVFPRVLEIVYRHYLGEVARRVSIEGLSRAQAEVEAMEAMRHTLLGNRVVQISVSSAPTTPEIMRFTRECFDVPITNSYGSTESGRVTSNDRIVRPPVIDYRLRDVPELGYYVTDKPYPRGELCVKTTTGTPGYVKRPDLTARLYDADGFLAMGDIVEERQPDHIVYIDRRNDVLKLSHGEFVAIGALGTKFENESAVIEQIFVHGNSAYSFLVAVIVPNMTVV